MAALRMTLRGSLVALVLLSAGSIAHATSARDVLSEGKRLDDTSRKWTDRTQTMTLRIVSPGGGELTRRLTELLAETAGVESIPGLVLEQPAGDQCLGPEILRRAAILGEELGQENGGVEVDHRRSPILAVARQLVENRGQRYQRLAGRKRPRRSQGRRQPPLSHRLDEQNVGKQGASRRVGRDQPGYDPVAVRDQHRLTAGRQADVLAEAVLEHLQTNGMHGAKVAPGSYLVKG